MKTGEGKSPMQLPVELASSLGVQFLLTKVSDGMADPFLFGKNERDNEQVSFPSLLSVFSFSFSLKPSPPYNFGFSPIQFYL